MEYLFLAESKTNQRNCSASNGSILQFSTAYHLPHSLLLPPPKYLFHFLRHLNQTKPEEDRVNIGHTVQISQCLWTFHNSRTDTILICFQNSRHGKWLRFSSPINPQLFRIFSAASLPDFIGKLQSSNCVESHPTGYQRPQSAPQLLFFFDTAHTGLR